MVISVVDTFVIVDTRRSTALIPTTKQRQRKKIHKNRRFTKRLRRYRNLSYTDRLIKLALNVDAWGRVYCSDVISASQVEQLMDSLQHIVATDDDDDEVQLVNLAVQQRRGRRRRQDSPSYAEPALEHRTV